MTIPVLAVPSSGVLAQPYLTNAMFKGFPHWLDLDDLIQGGVANVQDDALADQLLAASDWAVGECGDMLLHAHWVQNETRRVRVGAGGRIYLKPYDIPVRAVTSLSYGWDPSAMTSLSLPASSMWIEDGREVSFVPYGGLNFTGPAIQFGAAPRSGMEVYVQWSYIPGFPVTTVSAVTEGADSITVADPTGILPGDVLRCYDPGLSEAFAVSPEYAPAMPTWPPTATSVPLSSPAQNDHAAGTGVTEMPRKVLQAVIAYTVALLMRQDVSDEEPVSSFGPAARTTTAKGDSGQAGGLVNDARKWLAPYAPTLRS